MLSTLYLLHYNNYYNRLVKRLGTVAEYTALGSDVVLGNIPGVNFIPNDFVNTSQVVNWKGKDPDYVLVVENDEIVSRWFVVETRRTTMGQLELTLHRDLVVDFYNETIQAPCFIEKATIRDPETNDLIFNNEQMSYNQIKTKETLLTDQSEIPWICVYAARYSGDAGDANREVTEFDLKVIKDNVTIAKVFNSQTDFNNWILKKAADAGTPGESKVNITQMTGQHIIFEVKTGINNYEFYSAPWTRTATNATIGTYTDYGTSATKLPDTPGFESECGKGSSTAKDYTVNDVKLTAAQLKAGTDYLFPGGVASDDFTAKFCAKAGIGNDSTLWDEIHSYANAYVKVNVGGGVVKYYKVIAGNVVRSTSTKTLGWSLTSGNYPVKDDLGELFITMINNMDSYTKWRSTANWPYKGLGYSPGQKYPTITYTSDKISVSLQDVTSQFVEQQVKIEKARYHLTDSPYDMFVLPYPINGKRVLLNNSLKSGWTSVYADASLSERFANQILAQYAGDSGSIYDAQILPYCPLVNSTIHTASDGTIQIDLMDSDSQAYTAITESGKVVGYIYHASVSSFSRSIQLKDPIVIKDWKVESECDMYRICSPNYNGVFEFNAAMNGGVTTMNVQCTYRPFNPYIKVFPAWGRLYGENFSPDNYDARGLICGGDFSLPVVTSAWETYERQNKNYQAQFDRQIQNMRVNNAIAREQEKWSLLAGTVQGGAVGAGAGMMIGGGWGAVIGGAAGALMSGLAGGKDRQLNEMARQEQIKYAKDMFGFQLGNIQALPQSLSKSVAYTIDNKYFPFLEYYTCSDIEKKALRNKIKYNGMTVGVIGTIAEYMLEEPSYIKGQLIRIEDIQEDYHILSALADEINMGVFI